MGNKKGLTLFEFLVVMMIFSVATGLFIPILRIHQKETMRARIDGDLALLKAALKIYYFQTRTYPAPPDYQRSLLAANPAVMEKPLLDPFSESGVEPYIYKVSPRHDFYLAYSVGTLGNVAAEINSRGEVLFDNGDPKNEKWISNGRLK